MPVLAIPDTFAQWFNAESSKIMNMDSGKVVLGILAGIAAGATLGILLAPDKGAATRKKIYQKGDSYMEGLEEKFNEFIGGVTQKLEKTRSEAANMVENTKSRVESFVSENNDAANAKMQKHAL